MSTKFEISLTNKWVYSLIALVVILFLGVMVYAYGGSNPQVMGHSFEELEDVQKEVSGECPSGSFIRKINANGTVECESSGGRARTTYLVNGSHTENDWGCVHDVSLSVCGDEDGCTIRLLLQNKATAANEVHITDYDIYMEQIDEGDESDGVYGETRYEGGGTMNWRTGSGNTKRNGIFYYGADPPAFAVEDFKNSYCPDQASHSDTYSDPYTFSFRVHPNWRANVIVID